MSSDAGTVVLASVGTAAVLASLEDISDGRRPQLRVFVGAAVAGFLLLTLAEVAPGLAQGFAVLLLVGAVLRNGAAAVRSLNLT